MNIKKDLYKYLKQYGKNDTHINLYNKFPYRGSNISYKQKTDAIRSVLRKIKREDFNKDLKILIFDLETTPMKSYVWGIWKQNISPLNGQLQSEMMILSWSAKWLYSNKVLNDCLTPEEIKLEDDSRATQSLYNLINEADVIIAHNCNNYDVKVMNTRFIKHGLNPPTHYQVIDTLLHARKTFRLVSNKLDYLGKFFNLGQKHKTGFDLWLKCMEGDIKSLKQMVEYCDQDVLLLEAIYLKMRPWIKPHPNVNLIIDQDSNSCPVCNSKRIKEYGNYTTYANIYKAYQCNDCGSTFRARSAVKINKEHLKIVTPK